MKSFINAAGLALVLFSASYAQEGSKFTFDVGGGFTNGVGNTGDRLDTGWNFKAGAGYNVTNQFTLKFNVGHTSFGIPSSALQNLNAGSGSTNVLSVTLDPTIHINSHGHGDLYVTGGGGYYHRYQNFGVATTAATTGVDPFYGIYPNNRVIGEYTTNKPGIDAGIGIAFGTKFRGKIFAEAKWNRIFENNGYHVDYLPVTFGFRW